MTTKSQFHDIIPPEKRSIRNIPLANQTVSQKDVKEHDDVPEPSTRPDFSFSDEPHRESLSYKKRQKSSGGSKAFLWLLTIIVSGSLFFVATNYFASAEVAIETKKFNIEVPKDISLSLAPEAGQVEYSTVLLSDSVSKTVIATGEKEVSEYAKGSIVVYNAYNESSQKFVQGTRFETSSGLIYKTTKAIVVPGKKKVGGKDVPGSIEVSVIAEKPGQEYNIGLSDFTVPGLKTDPRFSSFYARSKSEMTGGVSGKVAVVSDDIKSRAVEELKQDINRKLKERVEKELPTDHVLLSGITSFEYKVSDPKLKDGKAIIEVVCNMKAYALDKNSFARRLLETEKVKASVTDTFTLDISALTVSGGEEKSATSFPRITLAGKVAVQYVFDKDKFKSSIVGIPLADISDVASKFPAIAEINAVIKPFWIKNIPADANKISIIEK